ncbi:MAG: hypothetical protein IPG22_17385 [Acidobacteria bacterium]|nr:hypothetical protein [Acidobacteriota bacterium]
MLKPRMYENRYGRFTAVDPLLTSSKSGSIIHRLFNRYAYVLNSPLIFTDPDGLRDRLCKRESVYQQCRKSSKDFPGKPRPGFKELTYDISTTTRIRGVAHHMDVTPNGWTIGNRVDGKTFERRAPERKSATLLFQRL